MTICTRCNNEKGTDFRKNRFVCRECDNEIARLKRLEDKKRAENEKPDFIICNKCEQKKTNFRFNRKVCIDCERAHGRNYRRTTDKAKIWAIENKQKISELQHNWYEKNKRNITLKRCERLKTNESFALVEKHRSALRNVLKGVVSKSKTVNCDTQLLRDWFQFQFHREMNFDNYAEVWNIDHVMPLNEFLNNGGSMDIIFDYLNTHPVFKNFNLTKNKHMQLQECKDHLERVKLFLKTRCHEYNGNYVKELEKIINSLQNNLDAGTALESEDTTQEENEAEEKPQQYAKLVFIDDDGNEF